LLSPEGGVPFNSSELLGGVPFISRISLLSSYSEEVEELLRKSPSKFREVVKKVL
jgi:hypothetical protein